MKKVFLCALALLPFAVFGCSQETPGGPGAGENRTENKPIVGEAYDTFTLSAPLLPTSLKQGETKEVAVDVKRGKDFDQDITLKFANIPAGLTVDPETIDIKHGDTQAKFKVIAKDSASVGDFSIQMNSHPAKGADSTSELRIKIDKK